MTYNGVPLARLLEQIPPGKNQWLVSARFARMETAVENGIPAISQFEQMDAEDKIQLIAYRRVKMKMQMWQNYLQQKEIEKVQQQLGKK